MLQIAKCLGALSLVTGALTTRFTPSPACSFGWPVAELMQQQGHEEETGKAKITPAFNLPCRYVLHTVGPIVGGQLTNRDKELLASCYCSCLGLAAQNNVKSLAFCCISTGEFRFPNEKAAEIAIQTVKEYRARTHGMIEVIFNVFKETDLNIYRETTRSKLKKLKQEIETADAIVIGAGAGLSTSAGFVYDGERFHKVLCRF